MKIRNKLIGGFLAVSCLLGASSLLTELIIFDLSKRVRLVVKHQLKEAEQDIQLNQDLQELRFELMNILILKEQNKSIEAEKKQINNLLSETINTVKNNLVAHQNIREDLINKNLEADRDKIEGLNQEIDKFIELEQELKDYQVQINSYYQFLDSDRFDLAAQFLASDLNSTTDEESSQKNKIEVVVEKLDGRIREIFKTLQNSGYFIFGFNLFGLILLSLLAKHLYQSISTPLEELKQAALEVEQGNLNYQLDIQTENEFKSVALAFKQMTRGLKNSTVSKFYLDKIVGSIIDSLIVVDLEGKIQKVNQATCNLLGYSEQELLGLNLEKIIEESSLSFPDLKQQGYLENKETKYLTKQGITIPIILSSSFIENKSNQPCGIVCIAKDIRERYKVEQRLKASEERYALAASASNDGLWDWNLNTNEIYYSERWKELLGYQKSEIKATPEEWFKRVDSKYLSILKDALENETTNFKITYPIAHKDGQDRWMMCQGIKVKDFMGKVYRIVGSQTDITADRVAKQQLYYTARHDSLTGLVNRYVFESELEKLLETAKTASDSLFSIILIDLNGFKMVNESLGYDTGDRLLIEVSKIIQSCLRQEDILARFRGDEFAVLLPKINHLDRVSEIVNRIEKQLSSPIFIQGKEFTVSASMAIVSSKNNYQKMGDMLHDADAAMYRAKAKNKGYQIVFEGSLSREDLNRLDLEKDLRKAIANDELEVFYLPIFDLKSNKITGFEALLRWNHPEKGEISPGVFIPIAEKSDLIVLIGNWVLEKVATQIGIWLDKYIIARDMFVSVNISVLQFKESDGSDFIYKLKNIIARTGIQPKFLQLEITESSMMENIEETLPLLTRIKDLGIKIGLDDFGTGYSSLSSLRNLPIDGLKIDNSFLTHLGKQPHKLELIKTIINIANTLNIHLIVEGIETKDQLSILKEFNCKYGQGYLFSHPVNAREAENMIFMSEQENLIQ
ncbi:MAG: EAL domain-containing protein [Prochloraceae cyanobacterium]|nr:EAL domain-containing protein [Prochloraceae cyanobacterium]